LQFGIDAARRFELEGAGAGDRRAFDAVAGQEGSGLPGLLGGLGDRLAAFLPAAQMLPRGQECAKSCRSLVCERTAGVDPYEPFPATPADSRVSKKAAIRICPSSRRFESSLGTSPATRQLPTAADRACLRHRRSVSAQRAKSGFCYYLAT
jgi:hypothetical protein